MKGVVAPLILVLSVLVRLDFCNGVLECKHGDASLFSEPYEYQDKSENKACPEEEHRLPICAAVMCAKAPGLQRGFSRIIWGCLPDQRGDYWAEEAKKEWFENVSDTELKGIECRAEFGEMGKNLSNANIQLPAVPKGLKSTTITEKLTISTTTATTTEKTSAMTITGKPTTTSTEGGPMSSMKQLASTISAANVSFRSSLATFWTMLMIIGFHSCV